MHSVKNLIVALALGCAAFSNSALASLTSPEAGKEYIVLEKPQQTESVGKIEVTEFFAYWCPHCNVLDPILTAWVKKQGAAISFKRVHIDFGNQQPLQRLFYTLEAMGKEEQFHSKIFKAIHVDRRIVRTDEDVLHLIADLGVDQKKYLETSQSFPVVTQIARAQAAQDVYKINEVGVPTISVDGHYLASPGFIRTLNPEMNDEQGSRNTVPVLDLLVMKAQKDHSAKK